IAGLRDVFAGGTEDLQHGRRIVGGRGINQRLRRLLWSCESFLAGLSGAGDYCDSHRQHNGHHRSSGRHYRPPLPPPPDGCPPPPPEGRPPPPPPEGRDAGAERCAGAARGAGELRAAPMLEYPWSACCRAAEPWSIPLNTPRFCAGALLLGTWRLPNRSPCCCCPRT